MLKLRNIFSRLQNNDLGSFKVSEFRTKKPINFQVSQVCMHEEVSKDIRDMKMAAAYKKLNSIGNYIDPEIVSGEIDKHLFQKVQSQMDQDEENALMKKIENENFEVSISMAKTAILMVNTNKAPGLDQINANFFKVMLKGGKGDEVVYY